MKRALIAFALLGTVLVPAGQIAQARIATRPNVLFILTDDQRGDQLRRMPTVKSELLAEGVSFSNALVPNAVCCPSRTSFLTGNYSHTTGVWGNRAPDGGFTSFDDSVTMATQLQGAGYRTGLFGKYLNQYGIDDSLTYVPPGWDEWKAFDTTDGALYTDFSYSNNGFPSSEASYSTAISAEWTSDFIQATPPGTPFFAEWTPVAPHKPTTPERRYETRYASIRAFRPASFNERDVSDKPPWVRGLPALNGFDRFTIDEHRRNMYRTLRSVDDGIATLLDTLASIGRLESTIIVYASDNGFMLGEHRVQAGKSLPYAPSTEIPMIWRWDGHTQQGADNDHIVGNVDLAPTILSLVGVDPDEPMDGLDISPMLLDSRAYVRSMMVLEHRDGGLAPAYCGTRTKSRLYVKYSATAGGAEEYYDYSIDPDELDNRIAATDRPTRAKIRAMRRFARQNCSPTPPGFSWA